MMIRKLKLIFIPCEDNNYRPKFLASRFLLYYIISLIILRIMILPFFLYLPGSVFFADLTSSRLVELINEERQSFNLGELEENLNLNQAALLKAQDMMDQDYFGHKSPKGITPWYWFKQAGYDYGFAGENLAIGFIEAEEVHQAWNDSPSHRANILNSNYSDIGIAVLKGEFQGHQTTLVVELFGAGLSKGAVLPKKVVPEETILQEEVVSNETPSQEQVVIEEALPEENIVQPEYVLSSSAQEEDSIAFKVFKFLAVEYENIVQNIIFYSLILIFIALALKLFVRVDVQHKDLILRTFLFIVLLILFINFDKEFLINHIPHNLLIN